MFVFELLNHLTFQSGVSQGRALFTLYINDLSSCIQFSQNMMYADDTVIYFASPNLSELELKLNLGLVNLSVTVVTPQEDIMYGFWYAVTSGLA